ncbi:hypothetical protein [Arthrobacter sp. 2MCAF14]|uniref:hypothetical protein n=1 Tax=Arthrobacter sp. 2MCAF14 TaxID=3232982 RepID=UPI003F923624
MAIIHFDTPTSGCVEPRPFTRAGRHQLAAGLAVPPDAAGSSKLEPSLAKAEKLAASYPDHDVVLTVMTDWELFDENPSAVYARLAKFPGKVFAAVLRTGPQPWMLDPRITVVAITAQSEPGTLAKTMFEALTMHRPDRKPTI